ncbi:carbohydrate-binding domain-containing protein [Mangrovibacterium sp.]|uniref:carbohydrate-binding domain-containing protein n=1 Tax=Mangrovibacterium sp. TaxID=1961364 RepID=UPI003561E82F
MKTTKQLIFLLGAITCFFLLSCERDSDLISETDTEVETDDDSDNIGDHDESTDYIWDSTDIVTITLNGSSISVNGDGATASGSKVTITAAGTYSVSGTLTDGQIVVDTDDETIVRLILNGVDISCSSNAPIYIEDAEKAMIVLADDTENKVADGSSYSSDEEDANAAIFSKIDLTLYGDGTLVVTGNYNDGITSKDGMIISGGNISVTAVDDGIRGKDYLIINNGNITVDCGGNGLKSDNADDEGRGYITINDGTIDITAVGDAIDAEKEVMVVTGNLDLTSGGGNNAYLSSDASAKGIKSGTSSQFIGGTITVNSADDAIHSDGDIEISGGTFYLASGDDGIHAEADLTISSGDIYITDAYEGLESALGSITITDGYINIIASDDGINVSAGGTTSGGGTGRKSASVTSDYALIISGGYIVIDCEGDGLDSNDLLDISGGTQLVNSDSTTENSSLDYDGTCVVSGGFLVGVGSSRMSMAPGSSSSQYSFLIDFSSSLSAGKIIRIQDSEGNEILTYEPHKTFQSLVFSSSKLTKGTTYEVYIGGSSSGIATDGLYSSGTYTGGTKYSQFTISSMVTSIDL